MGAGAEWSAGGNAAIASAAAVRIDGDAAVGAAAVLLTGCAS
jgi:hypothetical protein